MKANELRVGNWVYDIRGEQNIQCDLQFMKQAHDRLYPIPITEEWLLKFGFDKHPNPNGTRSWCYYKDRERWVIQSMLDLNSFSFGITPLKPELNFVHQLQNLYFALTGEELEILE
jgi:hypothetical protein